MSGERAKPDVDELSARLAQERDRAAAALEELGAVHEDELRQERDAKERAIAAAESRLAEIERQTEDAERRVAEAERRAVAAEEAIADERARARQSAAEWLRGQIDAIRKEGRQ